MHALALAISLFVAQGSSTMVGPGTAGIGSSGPAAPPDFFTYQLSAPASGSQCTDAAITSDQADAITCTRASTAYCTKADGSMVSHSNNRCRVESAGVLMEPARTNPILRSQEMNNASWTKSNVTVTADTTVAPDGTTTADTLTLPVGSVANRYIYATPGGTTTSGETYSYSIYAKPGTANFLGIDMIGSTARNIVFNLGTGAVSVAHGSSVGTVTAVANGFYRLTMTWVEPSARGIIMMLQPGTTEAKANALASAAENGETVIVWGAQMEALSAGIITSYIPTAGTSATRQADAIATTLDNDLDTSGCWAATVTYGAVLPASHEWLGTNGSASLAPTTATNLLFAEAGGNASINIASMLSTTTTARAYWSGSTIGLVSGVTSDTDPFSGHLGDGGPANVLDIGTNLFGHIRGLRANTNPAGCQ